MTIFPIIGGALAVRSALTAQVLSADANGDWVDTSDLDGNLLAVVNSAAGSSGDTLDVTIFENDTTSGSGTAVPADAIFNPSTGAVTTFAQITSAAASHQVVGIVKERVKRYIRLVFDVTGSGISIPCGAEIIGPLKYS